MDKFIFSKNKIQEIQEKLFLNLNALEKLIFYGI